MLIICITSPCIRVFFLEIVMKSFHLFPIDLEKFVVEISSSKIFVTVVDEDRCFDEEIAFDLNGIAVMTLRKIVYQVS